MIDIHTHILPGIDDGAQTIEESIEILKKAADEGVKTIVSTPHILEVPSQTGWQEVKNRFNALTERIASERINVKMILGTELFLSPDLPKLLMTNKELTIAGKGKYALIEFPFQEIPFYAEKIIFQLFVQGLTPILAHPERCVFAKESVDRFIGLIEKGALAQLNVGSLLGRHGKKVYRIAKQLLKKGYIHLMASDVHSLQDGSYSLLKGVDKAARIVGRSQAEDMVGTIAAGILE